MKHKKNLKNKIVTQNTESAGGVVLNKDNMILVVKQRDSSWSLPKGRVELNEEKIATAKREIKEESGVRELELIKDLGKYQRYRNGLNGDDDKSELKTIYMFLFKTKQNILKPIDPHNPVAKWVNQDGVKKLLTHLKDQSFFQKILDTELKHFRQYKY